MDNISEIQDINDANVESFLFDLSAVLRTLNWPYGSLVKTESGGLNSKKMKLRILSFLSSELMASKIIAINDSTSNTSTLEVAGKQAYSNLKKLIMLLKMGKPPTDISSEKLFGGIISKINTILSGRCLDNVIEPPMIKGFLTPMHCDKIDALAKVMNQDYTSRKNMLTTRLSVTLQSFIWAGRGKEKKEEVLKLSNTLVSTLSKQSNVSISEVLAARENILILTKTSSGATRTESDINKHTMKGSVADRGGRVTEIAAPSKETFSQQDQARNMPKWTKRQDDPNPGRGGGRGGRGGNRGRGGKQRNDQRGDKYGSQDSKLKTKEYYNSGHTRGGYRGGFKRGSFNS